MMKTSFASILLLLFTWTSTGCGTSDNKGDAEEHDALAALEALGVHDDKAGGNSCLLSYADKYDEFLTMEMVTNATSTASNAIKMEVQKVTSSSKFHDVTYSWKGSLKKTVAGMTVPVNDYVRLTGIEPISLKTFQMSYRAVSAEEAAQMQENASEALKGNSGNSTIDNAVKKLDAMGISKEDQQKMIRDLTASAQKVTEGFSAVAGLGQAATWNSKTNSLYVLDRGAKFELVVELSPGNDNLQIAKNIAEALLSKCK